MLKRNTHFCTQAVRHIVEARRKFNAIQPENPNRFDETAAIRERLIKIEALLQGGRDAEAILLANLGAWFDLARGRDFELVKANFNPDEPRDNRTKEWTTFRAGSDAAHLEDVQYRGHFHDVVVDDLIAGLNRSGGKAIKNISVLGISGTIAIPDGASLPNGWMKPYFIEVKTGKDPKFTPNQIEVYELICLGGHATSFDPRLKSVGLTPGKPLPPIDIMVVYTPGPGMPLTFHSYCVDLLETHHAP